MQPSVEQLARRLYDDCPTPKPTWDQIGEVTKSVWRGYADLALLFGEYDARFAQLAVDDIF